MAGVQAAGLGAIEGGAEIVDIVLTTFPAHKSRNVGDALITRSMIELVRRRVPSFDPVVLFRDNPLDGFTKRVRHRVFAPGFSVSNGTYPTLCALFTDLDRLEHFWAAGCSFQAGLPTRSAFETPYNSGTLSVLGYLAERFGPFQCRDALIADRLRFNGLAAQYFGDLALFDEAMTGKPLRIPPPVGTLALTLQHHVRYLEQFVDLAKRVRRRFPDWRRIVTMHSIPNPMYRILSARMLELGYEVKEIHGEADGLDLYAEVDLHIGYRLHGHIHFLRNRKPSILLIEDARAYGFARTEGTAFGCVDAWSDALGEPDDEAPQNALRLLDDQISHGFAGFCPVLDFIDRTFAETVAPYFDGVARVLNGSTSEV